MKISVLKPNKMYSMDLPIKISGNYWVKDQNPFGEERNLINIEEKNEQWILKSNENAYIFEQGKRIESVILEEEKFYFLKVRGENYYTVLYCEPVYDTTFQIYRILEKNDTMIGKEEHNYIIYQNPYIGDHQVLISYQNEKLMIKNLDPRFSVYVNHKPITQTYLENGDIIFLMGLRILIAGEVIAINNPKNSVRINGDKFALYQSLPITNVSSAGNDDIVSIYQEQDYFNRMPRFRTVIEKKDFKIDNPPTKGNEDEKPYILIIGPMITMAMMSMMFLWTAFDAVLTGTRTLRSAIPQMVMGFAMLGTMLIWPLITRKFEKNLKIKKEAKRQEKYGKYLEEKRRNILVEMDKQKQIIIDNHLPLEECHNIIFNRKRQLWERELDHDDFLELRIGIGNEKPELDLHYEEERFAMDEDNLRDKLYQIIKETEFILNVPLSISLTKKYISAIVGKEELTTPFLYGLLLQIYTFHSNEDVRIVIFTNKDNEEKWELLKNSPHIWSMNKEIRFFSATIDEANLVANYLEQEIELRKEKIKKEDDFRFVKPYYVILTDDYKSIRNLKAINDLLESDYNLGFSLFIQNTRLSNLPNQCMAFINIDEKESGMFENELSMEKQKIFKAEFCTKEELKHCVERLNRIPIDYAEMHKTLPDSIGFLQMYEVGKIEQLNVLNRWRMNNPILSLQAPVGIDENGELFKLDLHEKMHGPHGLIAGMTGSGKSEFIITYILSMAINYHPSEVEFVLIDYKGGGLAGAFENRETGLKLPHLAGTITNLDENEMSRALLSIESELKRRQRLFNKARESLNESTIDIYKYQKFYREGKVEEPMPHLFIISDEFAELKTQQPEFMEQLMSTARIGRSLGVHLILATQKPAGVVNDQIWSNSRFRVCLKVAEKSDSMDMIKSPLAASLKQVGRFYLQVGYNEFFGLGQSAYSGAAYYPTDVIKKPIDKSIRFVDNVGNTIKVIEENVQKIESKGEQLPNIVTYLSSLAEKENISVHPLWLDKIPAFILIEELKKKYSYQSKPYVLNPVLGEYDDPNNQAKGLFTLNLTENGNTIIYGNSGSGKIDVLNAMIYSIITMHSPEEVWFYLLDFGSETLRMFRNMPQVGDVAFLDDKEKIENLLKMLQEMIDERKKLLAPYNGDFAYYQKTAEKKLPTILVLMNNYEVFKETYTDYDELIFQISRDCQKYGILFVLTTTALNGVRYSMVQNFNTKIALRLNDRMDYMNIFGSNEKIVLAKFKGRGILLKDHLYEFQTAHICEEDHLQPLLETLSTKLNQYYPKLAKPIPVLPENITADFIRPYLTTLDHMPIGMAKNTLKINTYDFKNQYLTLITANELKDMIPFVTTLHVSISALQNTKSYVMDTKKVLKLKDNVYDYSEKFLGDLASFLTQKENIVLTIFGWTDFLGLIDKNYFFNFLKQNVHKNLSFLLVDTANNLKKYQFDDWYTNLVDPSNGIWIGNGIFMQNILKTQTFNSNLNKTIPTSFGYHVRNGIPEYIKLLGEYEDE